MSEQSDTLASTSYLRVVDLLCEGEIEGLVDGAKSIYLDDTPLQARDGTYNFRGFTWVTRNGTVNQSYVPGFSSVESITAVGVKVIESTPVVRTISNPSVDAALVTLGIPLLQRTDRDTGDIEGTSIRMRIEVQPNGGTWLPIGSTTSLIQLDLSSSLVVATVPAGRTATRLDVRVMAQNVSAPGAYAYRLEYRQVGGTSWATWRDTKLQVTSGTDYAVNDESGGSYTLYSAAESFTLSGLSAARYEARITSLDGIAMQIDGTCYEVVPIITISGKTSSRYQRQIRVPLPAGGAPWSIRVTRMSDDSTSQYLQNESWWDNYTEVIEDKLQYPYSALAALSVDAAQTANIPSRAYDTKLLRVKVPVNYDPLTRVYTGSWDGTFKTAWTDNPAWCFYDLLTHPRYGLGAFVGSGVDKWALYQIAQYCDALVPDGRGKLEPRFTCNFMLASRAEAFKVVQDMASIFRGMVHWSAGSITTIQDSPSTPVALFSPANVIDGAFQYSGSSAKVRHTVAQVTWNDPADLCRSKVEYVEDRPGIARFGIVSTDVVAIGCTSRGQAARVGRWLLFSERLQTDVVQFRTGLEGAVARPGQVIKVADPNRAGVRFGGRLLAATTTALTLDAPVTLAAGETYSIACLKADGSVQETTVATGAGTTSSLALSPALTEAPAVGSMWVLSGTSVAPRLYQVLAVSEAERNIFEVSAIEYEPTKFDNVELGLKLQPRSYSVLTAKPPAPTSLTVNEVLIRQGNSIKSRLDVSWVNGTGATGAVVVWTRSGGHEAPERMVLGTGIEIDADEGSTYNISVYGINALGTRSATAATASVVALGKTAPPSTVTGLVATRYGDTLTLSWAPVSDLDVTYGGNYEVRRGGSWATGVVVGYPTQPSLSILGQRGGQFMVRAVDSSGNTSVQDAVLIAPDLSGINVVIVVDDADGGFGGPKVNTAELLRRVSPSWDTAPTWDAAASWDTMIQDSGLTIVAPRYWSDMTMNWGAYGGAWLYEGAAVSPNYTAAWSTMTNPWSSYATPNWHAVTPATSGTYVSDVVDLGYSASGVVTLDATINLLSRTTLSWAYLTDVWSSYAAPSWTWQGLVDAIGAVFEVATSADGSTWTDWFRPPPGALAFRYIKCRVTLSTTDSNYRPMLAALKINVDVADRVEHFENVSVPSGGKTITFAPAFVGVQTVQVTLQSAASGDRFTVTGKSNTAVTINVFDSAGAAKAGLVDVDVFGYGERY